jgi:predicted nucleotidyltransferase
VRYTLYDIKFLNDKPEKGYFFVKIMKKIKKLLISQIICVVFIFNLLNIGYCRPSPVCNKQYLRVPIGIDKNRVIAIGHSQNKKNSDRTKGLYEPQLKKRNKYAECLTELMRGASDESIKRCLILSKIGPKIEKIISKTLKVNSAKIAILPWGSALKGYSTYDSDIEYMILVLSGISPYDNLRDDEQTFILEKFNSLIKKEGVDAELFPICSIISITNVVEGNKELRVSEQIEDWSYIFLPMAYGDPKLIETARENIITAISKEASPEYMWFSFCEQFLKKVSVNFEYAKRKDKIIEFLRQKGVDVNLDENIRSYLKTRNQKIKLPGFTEMKLIYLKNNRDYDIQPQSGRFSGRRDKNSAS